MNDFLLIGSIMLVVLCAMSFAFFYSVYWGVHDSLTNANIGCVYNFRYRQPLTGDFERYLAKVLNVRKLDKAEISRLNWTSDYRAGDKMFERSPTLVTCEMSNGDIRQFYAERSDMCRRTPVANMLFKAGVAHLF